MTNTKAEISNIIQVLQSRLEDEKDANHALAGRMLQNQKLETPEERLADGFTVIYGDLQHSKYRVEKLREAIAALKALS